MYAYFLHDIKSIVKNGRPKHLQYRKSELELAGAVSLSKVVTWSHPCSQAGGPQGKYVLVSVLNQGIFPTHKLLILPHHRRDSGWLLCEA